MATNKEIVVTLRLEDRGAVERLGKLEIETKAYQRELRALNAEIAKNGEATRQQTQRVGELQASIRRNQTVVRELKNDLSGATDAGLRFRDKMAEASRAGLGKLEIETKAYQRELRALNAEIAKNGEATRQQTQRVGELQASIRRNQTVVRELKNDLSGATDAGLRFRDKMAEASRAGLGAFGLNILSVAGGVTALVGVLRNAVGTLADFEKALSAVSALGGDYAARIDEISEATKTAGIQFGFTAVESVNAVEALAKAGVAVEDILGGGLEGALTLAAAGSLDVATAAEAAAKSMVQFGLAGQDVTKIADLFANSANKALGEVSDITAALNQSGQVANQFGIGIEETVGTLTAFANAGLLGSDAGTSFRTMLLRLAKPTEESAKLMERLGINAFNAQGEFVGIEALAGQLQTQLKDLTEEQRNAALATIFGTDAIRSASILYEGGAESIAKWTNEVNESGEAARIAEEKTDNLSGDVTELAASYDALILKESGVNDFFRGVVQGLTGVINLLSGNSPDGAAIAAFTERVQKEYAKIGGAATLAAEAGDTVTNGFRFHAEAAAAADQSLDLLLARGNVVRKQLADIITERRKLEIERDSGFNSNQNKEAIEQLRIQEAAGKAALVVINEQIKASGAVAVATAKAGNASATAAGEIDKETKAFTKLTAAQIEANRVAKEAAAGRAQPVPERLQAVETTVQTTPLSLTPEGVTKAEIAAQQYLKITEDIRILEIQGITDFNAQLLQLEAEKNSGKLKSEEEYQARKTAIQADAERAEFDNQQRMVAAAGDFFGALSSLAAEGSAEFKALATTQALINTYLGATQALSNPLVLNPFVKILQAAAIIANGLAAVNRIQGFAEGGRVKRNGRVTEDWGTPVNRSNGDTVLATLKPNEAVLNEYQQQRAKNLYGDDFFKRIGVPGFAGGGRTVYSFSKATGIAPRPSPGELIATERLAEQRAMEFAPVVSVVEINKVQNRTKVIENLASA